MPYVKATQSLLIFLLLVLNFLQLDYEKILRVNIKGITINDIEFKISQFPNDTTLTLDGSEDSLSEALTGISHIGTYSGLNINILIKHWLHGL